MQLFRNLTQARVQQPTVLTIGTFDGLHRGHQSLLDQLKQAAARRQAQAAVIAFHPRPKNVFAPHRHGQDYLTTATERIHLFEQLGLDLLILTPFTLELAQTPAVDFMEMLSKQLKMVELWAGHDFALGKGREGTVDRLAEIGQRLNYTVHEFDPFFLDGEVVSSTRIRQQVVAGEIRPATRLLGRYPSLRSEVIRGAQRGRTIGFPTANLAVPTERLIPANGVYATFVQLPGSPERYPSVTNVGVRPSFDGNGQRSVEAYIFDFERDIYGQTLNLEFVEHLRPEKKFEGVHELKAQIAQDSEQARQILAEEIKQISVPINPS